MVQKCIALAEDFHSRRVIADQAFEIVKRSYTVERFKNIVRNAVRAVLASPAAALFRSRPE
jgi:hypothetical protein